MKKYLINGMQVVADFIHKRMVYALKVNDYVYFDRVYDAGVTLLFYATLWDIELN